MRFPWLSSPHLWFLGFIFWVGYLFALSSNPESVTQGAPGIPHIDKILHFGYFMGGAGLFTTWLLLWKGPSSRGAIRIVLPVALFLAIAAMDEFQQSLSPGRSGNDPFDWLADALGSITGVLLANRFHSLLMKFSYRAPEKSHN
jgi:VanZ family protein